MLQDEKTMVATYLLNMVVVQENMGDKPIQAQKAINFLNSLSKMQLQFVGIQDRTNLIAHAKKYIVKDALAKDVTMKSNFLKIRAKQFKHMFKNLFDNGLPNFWNEEGAMIVESDYLSLWQRERDDTTSIDQLDPIIRGHHIYDVLDKEFCLFYEVTRIISNMPPPSYNLYSNLDVVNQDLLAVAFPSSSVWQRIYQFANKWILSKS